MLACRFAPARAHEFRGPTRARNGKQDGSSIMSDHVWVQENIAAYVAGGLAPAEGGRLEQHAAGCALCAHDLDEARSLERRLSPLFARANPGPALEDRIITALPTTPPPRRTLSLSRTQKLLLTAAAVFLFGTIGATMSILVGQGRLA